MHRLWTNVWTTGHRSPGHGRSRRPTRRMARSSRRDRAGGQQTVRGRWTRWPRQASITRRSGSRRSAPSTRWGCPNQERAFVRLCRLVGVLDQTALVRAPNTFTKDFLEQRVRDQIHDALAGQLGHPVQLAVSVDESLETDFGHDHATSRPAAGRRARGRASPRRAAAAGSGNGWRRPSGARRRARRDGDPPCTTRCATWPRAPPHSTAPTSTSRASRHTRRSDADGARPDPLQRWRERAAAPAAAPRAELARRHAAQPEVHLRHLRHRREQPLRPRGGGRGRRGPGQGVQPALRLRRVGAGQDPPAPRDRPLRPHDVPQRARALRELRGVHQRLHQQHP